jgi:uncharacterized protein
MHAMTETSKPWYREPWPWLLMIAPLAAVIMGVVIFVLADRTRDGLVADDYYKEGLAINRTLDRERRAATLHVAGSLAFSPDRTQVRLRLGQDGAAPPALLLTLLHPTRAGMDQRIVLIRTAPGEFSGKLRAPVAGRWLLMLEDDDRSWRVNGVWRTVDDRVSLRPDEEGGKP